MCKFPMKKSCLLFFLFFSFRLLSQEISVQTDSLKNIVSDYELKDEQWSAWKVYSEKWMKQEYGKILKANKLKMSCNGCENIFMDVVITIDGGGKLKYYKCLKSDKCGDEFSKGLEIAFMRWFFQQTFPKELYGLKFRTRLGTGIKC